jgi:hypothetical protein
MSEAKPFCISKGEVWEAYKRVKANKGAAGVDEQTIEDFEKRLKKNLYKIWNRMSSGSYFPPPVRTVKIPKANGGERKLGIPTVSDRIAEQVVKSRLEPRWIDCFMQTPTDIDRGSRHGRQLAERAKEVGSAQQQRSPEIVREQRVGPRRSFEAEGQQSGKLTLNFRSNSQSRFLHSFCSSFRHD